MNNKERGEHIRREILNEVGEHPSDIVKHIIATFLITPQAVNNHIKRLESEGWLTSEGVSKGKKYFLGENRRYESVFKLTDDIAEDSVWRKHFSFVTENLAENVADICYYGFTEMLNNVIDHSQGTEVFISVKRNSDEIVMFIVDNGEGIFERIKNLCQLSDQRQALFELSKGKLTTDPDNHTGEGIFFTSRAFDKFTIDSKGLVFSHGDSFEHDYLEDSNWSENDLSDIGTMVYMAIDKNSNREIQAVFDEYTAGPDEFQFNRTIIPVRLAQYENEKLVSRSQAKRVLLRIEKFQKIIFDFNGVSAIGQAFADEIFRVYSNKHPDIVMLTINMTDAVSKMVNRAKLK